jgi:hypothetical protein
MHRRKALPALAALSALAFASCGDEAPRSLRLVVGVHVAVAQIDEIRVQLIAGKDLGTGQTCEPEPAVSFSVHGAQDVPIIVDAMPGADYSKWVGYEVRWLLGGTEVSHRAGRQVWPASGAVEVQVMLEADCLGVPCGEDANCVAGTCSSVGTSPFDPTLRDPAAQDCIIRSEAP